MSSLYWFRYLFYRYCWNADIFFMASWEVKKPPFPTVFSRLMPFRNGKPRKTGQLFPFYWYISIKLNNLSLFIESWLQFLHNGIPYSSFVFLDHAFMAWFFLPYVPRHSSSPENGQQEYQPEAFPCENNSPFQPTILKTNFHNIS